MKGNVAIRSYYLLTEAIESSLLENGITKTVTIGDISDVDLGSHVHILLRWRIGKGVRLHTLCRPWFGKGQQCSLGADYPDSITQI